MSAPPPLRILLVEDHPAVRQGLALLLEQNGITVGASVRNGGEAVEALRGFTPAAIVLDLALAGESGLDLLPRLTSLPSHVPVLVYSMHEDPHRVRKALAAGAAGYVTKNSDADHLVAGIRAVALGGRYLDPAAARAMRDGPEALFPADPERVLSDRELKVFRLLGEGYGASDIGTRLGISRKTVESYCQRIMDKLGLDGMKALHLQAVAHHRPE